MNNIFKYTSLNNLRKEGVSFSYSGENGTVVSDIKGIGRLMQLCDEGFSLAYGYTSDKVIGKAAALLMIRLGAENVYGETVSRAALEVFEKHGVNVTYTYLVKAIINRTGDGICPMEKTVLGTDSPEEAERLLREKIKALKKS